MPVAFKAFGVAPVIGIRTDAISFISLNNPVVGGMADGDGFAVLDPAVGPLDFIAMDSAAHKQV